MTLVNPLDMTTAETLLRIVLAVALGAFETLLLIVLAVALSPFVAGIVVLSLLGALVADDRDGDA